MLSRRKKVSMRSQTESPATSRKTKVQFRPRGKQVATAGASGFRWQINPPPQHSLANETVQKVFDAQER